MAHSPRSSHARAARLAVEALEDRTTPTFLARPGAQQIGVNNVLQPTGGLSVAAGDLFPEGGFGVQNEYVTGTGPGTLGTVRVWELNGLQGGTGAPILEFVPFPGFNGGINVAVGDVVGDGRMEIIAAVAGNGPPHVKIFSPTGQELSSFLAFEEPFLGGVNVAVGNVLGGIRLGGYSGGQVSKNFKQEIIVGAAAGGVPHVVVTDSAGTILRSFLAFDLGYQGGVTVAAGSIDTGRQATALLTGVDNDSYDEIIVGAATEIPHVKTFDVFSGAINERLSFYAFDPAVAQGVTVAAGSTDGRRGAEIYVSQIVPRTSIASPTVRMFDGTGLQRLEFTPFPITYTRVVNMAVAYLTPPSRGPSFYNSADDNSPPSPNGNNDYVTQDLVLVAGDGPYFQEPRFYNGSPGVPAGSVGP